MPWLQTTTVLFNNRMSHKGVVALKQSLQDNPPEQDPFGPDVSLFDSFRAMGVDIMELAKRDGDEAVAREYIDNWPAAIQTAFKAIVRENLARTEPDPVTLAWAPGAAYEMTIWEVPGTSMSPGGITILIKSMC